MKSESTNNTKVIEKKLSYELGRIFFEIQNESGRFCREKQYGDLLEKKLKDNKIEFQREYPIPVADKKSNFVDFIVDGKILVDLKAKPFIKKDDFFQMKRYLIAAGLELGIIINFRDEYLKPRRVLNGKFVDSDKKFVASDRSKGFTLVELLVAMSLFLVTISIATGTFIQTLRGQRMTVAIISANNNASLTMEQMAREIRTGTGFSIKDGDGDLQFTNARGEQVVYHWDSVSKILNKSVNGGGSYKPLTADNVRVMRAEFILFNGDPANPFPPRVTVLLGVGAVGLPFTSSVINLQMTVSGRTLE